MNYTTSFPKNLSHLSHDTTDYSVRSLEEWRIHNNNSSICGFNGPEIRVKDLLEKNPHIRDYAIDIGCGGGWMSNELSKYFQYVISIDPSNLAIENVCKKLYPQENIIWINGYAEDALENINFDYSASYFINTCSVFQHMSDEFVSPIITFINKNFKHGILSFQEWWSEDRHFNQGMGNCRTKKWWSEQLSNWDIDFHGPSIANSGAYFENINKGLHAKTKSGISDK